VALVSVHADVIPTNEYVLGLKNGINKAACI
jgi:hypothetical protein